METTSASPSADPMKSEESSGAVEETPEARALGIGARLPRKPSRTVPLEDIAAEGASADVWEANGQLQKVVVELKGETYDSRHTIYFEGDAPLFARFYKHFDPAKLLESGDEGYKEGVAAREIEVVFVTYLPGGAKRLEVGRTAAAPAAKYDEGALVEVRPLPEREPTNSGGYDEMIRETEAIIAKLR